MKVTCRATSGKARYYLKVMWFVYILKCTDGNLYAGCTENIEDRLKRHNAGYVAATKRRISVVLITYIAFTDKYKAF